MSNRPERAAKRTSKVGGSVSLKLAFSAGSGPNQNRDFVGDVRPGIYLIGGPDLSHPHVGTPVHRCPPHRVRPSTVAGSFPLCWALVEPEAAIFDAMDTIAAISW